MPKILVLPDHIASQIAAGEVVERPSSVVKELVENSIDAGATRIEISVNADCRDIRVADNGCGMEAQDAVLAFHRHATSKLSTADDLWNLSTMGFRGEALPSISSVAKVTCYTKSHNASEGTKVESADGKVSTTSVGCASGTIIEVHDLFYNVPARLKFLKKPTTEFAHMHEIVQALAIAFPKIVFHLLNNGETVFKTTGSGKLLQAIIETNFLPKNLSDNQEHLKEISFVDKQTGIEINGHVASPVYFRGDRKAILSMVNKRPVRCHLSYKALDYAFQDLIPRGKYPIAVLMMNVNPAQVDINVHPTKKEIKYNNGNDIYRSLQRAIVDATRRGFEAQSMAEPAPQLKSTYDIYNDSKSDFAIVSETRVVDLDLALGQRDSYMPRMQQSMQQMCFDDRLSYKPAVRDTAVVMNKEVTLPAGVCIIGYLQNTYILLETSEGLEIVEQHIAHERTLYERLLKAMQASVNQTQPLIISAPLNLSPQQKTIVHDHLSELQKLGFDFEISKDEVTCTQVPLELAHKDYASVVQRILEELAETTAREFELEAIKSIACQSAIKNGMHLSEYDMIKLLAEWYQSPRNDTCPHGRPVKLKFSMDKLFQMFHPV